MDLTTLARVKVHLEAGAEEISDSNTRTTGYISALITLYSEMAAKYLGSHSQATARTETYDWGRGQRVLVLRGAPASALSSIRYDLNRDFDSSTELDTDDYTLITTPGHVAVDRVLDSGYGVMRVTYTGGLATSTTAAITAFPDIAGALDVQVAHHFMRRKSIGASAVSMPDGGSLQFPSALDWIPQVRKTLISHRRFI